MHVIAKRALHFRHPSGEKKNNLVLKPLAEAQPAPEWIRDTAAFEHATKDGSLVEVQPRRRGSDTHAQNEPAAADAKTEAGELDKAAETKSKAKGNRKTDAAS